MYDDIYTLAASLKMKGQSFAVAESCTGGGLAKAITDIPGSSAWFDRGVVTYSNQAKQDLLNVSAETLEQYGAVSEQTAREMAEGLLASTTVDITISITGIAGPEGGSKDKPVGTVWFGFAGNTFETQTYCQQFSGDRLAIREAAIQFSLQLLGRESYVKR